METSVNTDIKPWAYRMEPDAPSFEDKTKELWLILGRQDTPKRAVASAIRLLNVLPKCLLVVPQVGGAVVAPEPQRHPLLQPSDLFNDYVAACAAADWDGALVLEHRATHH